MNPLHQFSLSSVQLAWLALRSQKRRRRRGATHLPPAPLLTSAWSELGATEADWFDIFLEFSFEHGAFPIATLEIWFAIGEGDYLLLDTVPSTATAYHHVKASQAETPLSYKLRYVSPKVLGPFCPPTQVIPQA